MTHFADGTTFSHVTNVKALKYDVQTFKIFSLLQLATHPVMNHWNLAIFIHQDTLLNSSIPVSSRETSDRTERYDLYKFGTLSMTTQKI